MANPEHVEIVLQGAEAIAAFRKKNPAVRFELQDADLRSADLSGADLRSAQLSFAILSGADPGPSHVGTLPNRTFRRISFVFITNEENTHFPTHSSMQKWRA